MLQRELLKKYHTTLYDYFVQWKGTTDPPKTNKEKKRDNQKTEAPDEKSALTTYPTENVYLQIILIKIQENGGQMTNTYPLLDSGIQSKLFRQEYKWKL